MRELFFQGHSFRWTYKMPFFLLKIYISTFIQEFVFYFKLPSLPPTCWNFLSTFIQEFIFQFPTTLTTIDFLKSLYKLLLKNFFQTTLTTTDLLKLFYQHLFRYFFFRFPTTLTTSDFLKSIYQHSFKNLFFISNYPHD